MDSVHPSYFFLRHSTRVQAPNFLRVSRQQPRICVRVPPKRGTPTPRIRICLILRKSANAHVYRVTALWVVTLMKNEPPPLPVFRSHDVVNKPYQKCRCSVRGARGTLVHQGAITGTIATTHPLPACVQVAHADFLPKRSFSVSCRHARHDTAWLLERGAGKFHRVCPISSVSLLNRVSASGLAFFHKIFP